MAEHVKINKYIITETVQYEVAGVSLEEAFDMWYSQSVNGRLDYPRRTDQISIRKKDDRDK